MTQLPMTQLHDEDEVSIVPATGAALVDAAQVKIAKDYPRDLVDVTRKVTAAATMSGEFARKCIYSLPRMKDGQRTHLVGKSVRLAELCAALHGNLRCASRILPPPPLDRGRYVYAEAVCIDLESNYGRAVTVKRRITDSRGRTYSDDMIAQTEMAAQSIAFRNAVFAVVPAVVHDVAFERACKLANFKGGGGAPAAPKEETIASRMVDALQYFSDRGVTAERLIAAVGATSVADINDEKFAAICGLATRIDSGEAVDAVIPMYVRQ